MQVLVKCAMKIKEIKRKKQLPHKFCKDFIRLYQKTGWDDFNNELRVTDSTLNEGINCRVTSKLGRKGCFVRHGHTNECHKTCNGWYLGMAVPTSFIVGILILVRTYYIRT